MSNRYFHVVVMIILGFYILVSLNWIDAQAQEIDQELKRRADSTLLQMLGPFFSQSIKKDIDPIFINLASAFSKDKKLSSLLKAVRLEIFARFTGPYSAKAAADRSGAYRSIQVDMSFISSTRIIARVAACEIILPKSFHSLIQTWKQAVGEVIRKAIQSGAHISSMPSFNYWDFQADQMLNKYIEHFAEKAYLDILTWVILHEMAHHYLGHLDSEAHTDQISRERELAADFWGFQKMKSLGYSLAMVFHFLVIQAELEEKIYGSVAEAGSHPSWYARARRLAAHFDPNERIARPIKLLQCVLESKNQRTGGLYTTDAAIMFPINPTEYGSVLGAITVGNKFQFLATKIIGKKAYLYGRVLDGRSNKIIVKNADSYLPTIEIRDTDSPSSAPYCTGAAFENHLVHYHGVMQRANIPVRQLFMQSPRAITAQTLRSTLAGPAALRAAQSAVDLHIIAQNDLVYGYMKGKQSLSSTEKALNAESKRYMRHLRAALGSDCFARFESALYKQDFIHFGMSNLLRLSRDSNRRSFDIFFRLRGHRVDLKPASRQFKNVRLRNIGLRQLDSPKEIISKYEMDAAGGFPNDFIVRTSTGGKVIVDKTSNLMWQHYGSDNKMEYAKVQSWITHLNSSRYAGFSDWRLPTLEEALTLLEPEYFRNEVYIQPVFARKQRLIWTSDHYLGTIYVVDYQNGLSSIRNPDEECFVRAVRSLY